MYYIGVDGRGDIIIDNSYTKFLSDLKNECTAKLIQNMIAWIARVDYHYMKGSDPKLYRPKLVEYKFDPNNKCDKNIFAIIEKKEKPKEEETKELKTILAIDNSGSTQNKDNYHNYIKNKILPNYFKKDRGDAIYIWESGFKKISYEEMMNINNNKSGSGGTSSSKIAQILTDESNNNYKHLVIVTDGEVSSSEISNSDNIMKNNKNIKLKFVSTFIIETGGSCNLSVGAPYCRDVPNSTILVLKNGEEKRQPSLFKEDIKEWENLEKNNNYSQKDFLDNFNRIQSAVKAKTLGSSSEETLKVLKSFKSRISNKNSSSLFPEFVNKIDSLIKMAKEGNMDLSLKVT